MAAAFLAGLVLGVFAGGRAGIWWALRQLGAYERRERRDRVRIGSRRS